MKTTTPIKLNHKKQIIDGQHRLTAVVESGIGHEFLVAQGCPDGELLTQDIGVKRTLADIQFIISKGSVSHQLCKVHLSISNALMRGVRSQSTKTSDLERLQFYAKHAAAITAVVDVWGNRMQWGFSTPSVVPAIVVRASYSEDFNKLHEFIDKLRGGIANDRETAVIVLRDYLMRNSGYYSGSGATLQLYQRAQRALQAFLQGTPLKLLRPVPFELFPLPGEKQEEEDNNPVAA